jgi:betaine-aldehyde dehydrogenase
MDVPAAGQVFEHFAENLEQYLAQETIEINSPIAKVSSNLIRQPRGVSVLIVPFNYPLLIACWKLAASLAAGNTVILKPSSLTPLSVMELAKLIDRCGLPVGVVNILNVPGEQAGKILCSDKRVDMISFTGSNSAGKKIIEYSSSNIKKLTMELGGKSASLIFADADYQAAINAGLCSIFLNQGQMCTAMSRILIEDKIYNQFKNEFVEKAAKIKLGDGREFETQMGPLISRSQQENCVRFITAARTAGAKILTGGKIPSGEQFTEGFFFEPTVLEEVTAQMDIFQQEVFGPIVCLVKFSTVEQAINLANDSSFALAACVWSKDLEKAKAIAEKINAGTIWINTYGMFFPQLPYGGFKQSGFGKELGKEGLGEYTCLKNIITDLAEKPMTAYWYGF